MSDPLGTMTERQREEWPEAVAEAGRYAPGITDNVYRYWVFSFEEETRPGRGHTMDATWCDGEYLVQIHMDVYGYGGVSVAETRWLHNSSDEGCECTSCEKEREENE